ncbi:MAG: vWA domain-containing protein, partial [Actinomycetota bacterium]
MLTRLLDFTHALRNAGVPVAASENIDALRALGHVPFDDREAFRAALATTMVKSEAHRQAFDVLFELYFGAGPNPEATEARDAEDPDRGPEEYLEELFRALLSGDASGLRDLARR